MKEEESSTNEKEFFWQIYVRFKNHRVTHIQEIPAYTIPELLAELGGILGLLTGMSVLTIVELLACLGITVAMYASYLKR